MVLPHAQQDIIQQLHINVSFSFRMYICLSLIHHYNITFTHLTLTLRLMRVHKCHPGTGIRIQQSVTNIQ